MLPLTDALPGALIQLLRDTPLSDGKVGFAWRAAVGPALERVTAVKLEGAVLIVETQGAQWAREVRRSASVILPRLQSLLGRQAVTSITTRVPAGEPLPRRRRPSKRS
jgi:predicted nucleic acid-binding Zn ribbon protein